MSDIRPFCAVRPNETFASKIAALPYDVYTRKEAKKEVEKNPLSFLKIDRIQKRCFRMRWICMHQSLSKGS